MERLIGSFRRECLDDVIVLNERHLRRVLVEYVAYFNHWRSHRSVGRRAPCAQAPPLHHWGQQDLHVVREIRDRRATVYDLAV